jgi:protein tyrosine phosphatase
MLKLSDNRFESFSDAEDETGTDSMEIVYSDKETPRLDLDLSKSGDGLSVSKCEMDVIALEYSFLRCEHVNQASPDTKCDRYTNITASENERVKVDGVQYFNANYVYPFSSNSSMSKIRYIATQAPLKNTVNHFWRMIWDSNCEMIVMLCKLIESKKEKCVKYWPSDSPSNSPIHSSKDRSRTDCKYGDISVSSVGNEDLGYAKVRTFLVERNGVKRRVFHLQMLTWPDFETPKSTDELRNFIVLYHRFKVQTVLNGVDVVHCSAGVGRTGSFIASLAATSLISTFDGDSGHEIPDIQDVVSRIRTTRPNSVQSADQYIFIYKFVLDCIIMLIQGGVIDKSIFESNNVHEKMKGLLYDLVSRRVVGGHVD